MQALEQLVKMIIEDKAILADKTFLKVLSAVALDFFNFTNRFNGGNCRDYNLNRAGKTIQAIFATCCKPREDIDWEWMLNDIIAVNEAANFDFTHNMHMPNPEFGLGYLKDNFDREYKYKRMKLNAKEAI